MAKDKILQITGVGDSIAILTQTGRILYKSGSEWIDETPYDMLVLDDIPRFEFGKHKGEPIADAKPRYLDWCRENIEGFTWTIVDGKLIEEPPF
jgi:hypothetical protein